MSYWTLLAVSLIFSAVGFIGYVYFFSLGYGLSVAAIGAALAIGFWQRLTAGTLAACMLLVIYGLRLAGYLLIREKRRPDYRKILSPEMERGKKIPLGFKALMWAACAVLYTLETIPVYFRLKNNAAPDPLLYVGLGVSVCGLILETAADIQKSAAKKKAPGTYVSTGLYRWVRCPNYLGELIFWLGVLLHGAGALRGPGQWIPALMGYALIVYVMFSGARRLELRQMRTYGSDPVFQTYAHRVPILIPFIPLYSLEKYKWLMA